MYFHETLNKLRDKGNKVLFEDQRNYGTKRNIDGELHKGNTASQMDFKQYVQIDLPISRKKLAAHCWSYPRTTQKT